jgi:hypothetical protein
MEKELVSGDRLFLIHGFFSSEECEAHVRGSEAAGYDILGNPTVAIVPRQGTALVFAHSQLHEGAPVLSGRKYVLRTDVLYRRS